jgi:hypothetical protein
MIKKRDLVVDKFYTRDEFNGLSGDEKLLVSSLLALEHGWYHLANKDFDQPFHWGNVMVANTRGIVAIPRLVLESHPESEPTLRTTSRGQYVIWPSLRAYIGYLSNYFNFKNSTLLNSAYHHVRRLRKYNSSTQFITSMILIMKQTNKTKKSIPTCVMALYETAMLQALKQ